MLEINYKTESRIMRVVNSDIATGRKISKLDIMALRAFPSSPMQNAIVAARDDLRAMRP